ncbi:unnamed protein product [Mytilus edulis]|uniref:ATP-dependent DNA helicase n=1 Tax=Mytilus edulis TaxID=6550 RepID=A0A8S3S8X5_MYTED|nr:unnamed protein product [Mytilus edulis]
MKRIRFTKKPPKIKKIVYDGKRRQTKYVRLDASISSKHEDTVIEKDCGDIFKQKPDISKFERDLRVKSEILCKTEKKSAYTLKNEARKRKNNQIMPLLKPATLTVLSGITVLEKELPLNELPVPVIEILCHLREVIRADATYTYRYDFQVISFNNDNLIFNEYGDSAYFKDEFNNVYTFDFIEIGLDYFLHCINVSSNVLQNEESIKTTIQHLGLSPDLLGKPSLEIVLYCKVMDEGILVNIHSNSNIEENLKTMEDGIKLELCEPLNCRKEEIEGLESSTVDSTSKLENEKILETIYGKNLKLPFNYIIPRKITTDNLQNSLNDCHASTSKDISNSDTIKSSEKRKLWLLKKRQDPIYKSLQQKKDAERKQLKRKYPQVLQKESEYKKKMRQNPEVLQREKEHKQKFANRQKYRKKNDNINVTFVKIQKCYRERKNINKKFANGQKYRKKSVNIKGMDVRLNPEVSQKEKEHKQEIRKRLDVSQKERQHKRDVRLNPEVSQREKEHKQEIRKRPEVSQKERQHKRDVRLNPEVSQREKEHKQEIRKRPEVSQKELQHKRDIRQNPEVSQREKEHKQEIRKRPEVSQKERQHKKDVRLNPGVLHKEKQHKRKHRLIPGILQKENQQKKIRLKANNIEELITKFHKIVTEGPLNICTCCKQLLYKKAVTETSKAKIKKGDNSAALARLIEKCVTGIKSVSGREWIFKTCHGHLKKSKMPPSAAANGMEFPPQGIMRNLNPLEFTFLSPLLPFMKIHKAPVGKQLKIQGNMVVVPSDTVNTVQSLPRLSNNTSTIKAQLKRRLRHKHSVYSSNIRPEMVREGAKFLSQTEYQHSDDYNENNNNSDEEKTEDTTGNTENLNIDSEDEWEEEKHDENVAGSTDTLLSAPDFFESNERDLVYSFAPAENNQPISIFIEKTAEEQAYPGIFCGQARIPNDQRTVPVSYGEIVKSELRNMDYQRVVLLKPQNQLESMNDDDDEIECKGLLSRYPERPKSMETLSLAEFASLYERVTSTFISRSKSLCKNTKDGCLPEKQHDEDQEEDEDISYNKTTPSTSTYRERRKPKIIRSVHYNPDKDIENYHRELLMLYSPWRNEELDILAKCSTYTERFQELKPTIEIKRQLFEPYRRAIKYAEELLSNQPELDEGWNGIAPNTQHRDQQDAAQREKITNNNLTDYDIGPDLGVRVSATEDLNSYNELSNGKFCAHMRSLNQQQIQFVYNVVHQIKTSDKPVYHFLSGGAGVGKSFVTKALYQMILKFYNRRSGDDFTTPKVLLMAPTGKAAYNINGNTIHSTLRIPCNQSLQFRSLESSSLNTLQTKLGNVQLIFIDEISMVGFKMLNFIHQRLMEIKQSKEPFGGVSIIAVGDLFQLKPVMDSYIFQPPKSGYMPLAINLWEDLFCMIELTIIMRQRENKEFAELLNRLREGNHTSNDIELLKTQCIEENTTNYPHDTPHVFFSNKKVNGHNATIFQKTTSVKTTAKAKDRLIGNYKEDVITKVLESFQNKSTDVSQLSTILEIAENLTYEITLNLDCEDGLINGAACIVKKIKLTEIPFASGIIWVKFPTESTGNFLRQNKKHLYSKDIQSSWTPIEPASGQFAAGYKGESNKYTIGFLNANSLHKHIEDVRLDYSLTSADLICFCETRFLHRDNDDATKLQNFHTYRQDSNASQGYIRPSYGLAIYYKKCSFVEGYPKDVNSKTIESSLIQLQHPIKDLLVCFLYRPPKIPIKSLLSHLKNLEIKYFPKKEVILMGDFNVDWSEQNAEKQQLQKYLNSISFTQLITTPTTDDNTCIDLIFTNLHCNSIQSGTLEVFFSPHKPVWIAI